MKLQSRFLISLLPLLLCTVLGCSAPGEKDFGESLSAAGIQPIGFIATGMPTDVDAVADANALTLNGAVNRTLQHDPGIQIALANLRLALADARQTRLLPNPVLSVAVRLPESGGDPVIEAGLAADLMSLLLRPRQIGAADHRLRAASAEALTTVLDTLVEVQQRYAKAQALDAEVATLEERRRIIQRLVDLAKARLQAGESGRLDVITLDSERAALDVQITETTLDRREQRLALSRLIGEPSGAADWQLSPWSPVERSTAPESAWIAAAMMSRPEIQARLWELAALGDEAAIAGWRLFDGSEIGVDSERDPDWTLGPAVTVPIPFFDWGQERGAKAQAQQIEARHRLTQTRRQVIEEVRVAVATLRASESALEKVRTELIPLADQRREQVEASYKSGFADITAVLLAEQDAQSARSKLIGLQQKVSTARFRLQRAAGGPAIVPATQPTTQTATQPAMEQP